MLVKRRFYATLLVVAVLLLGILLALKPRGDAVVHQGKPLRAWAIEASSGNPEAIAVLKNLGTNAIPGLVDLLQRKDSSLRRQLGAIASKLPRRVGARLFSWATGRNTVRYRSAAAKALGILGPEAEAAIPELIKALHDSETQVSWDAASALGRVGRPAVPELMRALADSSSYVRHCAAYALGEIGAAAEPAVPALIESLMDTNRDVRASAAYSTAIIGSTSMLAISNTLDHGDANARDAAVRELVRFQRSLRIPIPALAKMAAAPEASSRQLALAALGALRIADNTTLNAVTNALGDESPEVRLAAVKSLKSMIWRAGEAVPQLTERLGDQSPAVREWTVSTLGEIGGPAVAALPELRKLAASDPGLRVMAASAIHSIEGRH